MKAMATKKLKAVLIALGFSLFLGSCVSTSSFTKVNKSLISSQTEDGFNPANFVSGDYQIYSKRYNYPILIDGDYDQGDDSKPRLKLLKSTRNDGVIDTKSMLSICPIDNMFLENTYQTYYISSPADSASRIDCIDGNFAAGNLWFFKEKDIDGERTRENAAQKVFIESKVINSETIYRFFYYSSNTKYYLAVDYNSNDLRLILVNENLRKSTYAEYTKFYLKTFSGKVSLPSVLGLGDESNISLDNITKVDRTLNYIQKKRGAPKFSKPFSFSLAGNSVNLFSYSNNSPVYSVAYNDTSLRINANLVYQSWWTDFYNGNEDSYTWKTGMLMEATDRKDFIRGWKLDVLNDYPQNGTNTNGVFVVQKYDEVIERWSLVYYAPFANPTNNRYVSSFGLDWDAQLSSKPSKFRVGFVFKMFGEIKSDTKIVVLKSQDFYLMFDGGSTSNFLPVQVAPANGQENTIITDGNANNTRVSMTFRDEDYAILLPNSCVNTNGFFVKPLLQGYYAEVYFAKNYFDVNNQSATISKQYKIQYGSMKTFTDVGRYTIFTKTANGNTTNSGYIYICDKQIGQFLFPNKFSHTSNTESAFISGNRMASGELPYELSSLGLTSKYPDYNYPTYYQKVTIKDYLKRLSLVPSLKAILYRYNDENLSENYGNQSLSLNQLEEGIVLEEDGFYGLVIGANFNSNCGLNFKFTFAFYIVNEPEDSTINFSLKAVSQEIYDLKPFAYSVFKEYVTSAYFDEDYNYIFVQIPVYYVFADYNDALVYALTKCKKYVTEIEPGVFQYMANGETILTDEIGAFNFIYELAKSLVDQKTMTQADYDTITGFALNEQDFVGLYADADSVPPYYLITTDKDQLAKLTDRQFINNFQFFKDSDGVVSQHIEIYDENHNLIDDNVPYFVNIEQYMISKNLPNGNYIFIDVAPTTKSYIYATYIRSKSETYNHCDAIAHLFINNQEITLNMDNNDQMFNTVDSFTLIDVNNPFDNYSLITVTRPDGTKDLFASHDDINKTYNDFGLYIIHIEDRLGNYYEFKVKVGDNNE